MFSGFNVLTGLLDPPSLMDALARIPVAGRSLEARRTGRLPDRDDCRGKPTLAAAGQLRGQEARR